MGGSENGIFRSYMKRKNKTHFFDYFSNQTKRTKKLIK